MLVDSIFADLAGVAALYRKFMQIAYGKVRVDIFGIECGSKGPSSFIRSFIDNPFGIKNRPVLK